MFGLAVVPIEIRECQGHVSQVINVRSGTAVFLLIHHTRHMYMRGVTKQHSNVGDMRSCYNADSQFSMEAEK